MIGQLRGVLVAKNVEAVLVDVQGVGYEVSCPTSTLEQLPREGEPCTLIIHTHVREDAIVLFGFASADDRALFRQLTGVSGVGPKLALACLSGLSPAELELALASQDVKRLATISGIGKRTAERLVLELKDKVFPRKPVPPKTPALPAATVLLEDLSSALRNLGYRPKDVERLLETLPTEGRGFDALLRDALSSLSRTPPTP